MKTTVFASLRKANTDFCLATSELNRPTENVMTLCACQSTRKSVIEFLRAYLLFNGNKNVAQHTMEKLFDECCNLDSGFQAIDLSCFLCKTIQEDCVGGYCLDNDKVNKCFDTAKVVKEFVLAKMKINPMDLY